MSMYPPLQNQEDLSLLPKFAKNPTSAEVAAHVYPADKLKSMMKEGNGREWFDYIRELRSEKHSALGNSNKKCSVYALIIQNLADGEPDTYPGPEDVQVFYYLYNKFYLATEKIGALGYERLEELTRQEAWLQKGTALKETGELDAIRVRIARYQDLIIKSMDNILKNRITIQKVFNIKDEYRMGFLKKMGVDTRLLDIKAKVDLREWMLTAKDFIYEYTSGESATMNMPMHPRLQNLKELSLLPKLPLNPTPEEIAAYVYPTSTLKAMMNSIEPKGKEWFNYIREMKSDNHDALGTDSGKGVYASIIESLADKNSVNNVRDIPGTWSEDAQVFYYMYDIFYIEITREIASAGYDKRYELMQEIKDLERAVDPLEAEVMRLDNEITTDGITDEELRELQAQLLVAKTKQNTNNDSIMATHKKIELLGKRIGCYQNDIIIKSMDNILKHRITNQLVGMQPAKNRMQFLQDKGVDTRLFDRKSRDYLMLMTWMVEGADLESETILKEKTQEMMKHCENGTRGEEWFNYIRELRSHPVEPLGISYKQGVLKSILESLGADTNDVTSSWPKEAQVFIYMYAQLYLPNEAIIKDVFVRLEELTNIIYHSTKMAASLQDIPTMATIAEKTNLFMVSFTTRLVDFRNSICTSMDNIIKHGITEKLLVAKGKPYAKTFLQNCGVDTRLVDADARDNLMSWLTGEKEKGSSLRAERGNPGLGSTNNTFQ